MLWALVQRQRFATRRTGSAWFFTLGNEDFGARNMTHERSYWRLSNAGLDGVSAAPVVVQLTPRLKWLQEQPLSRPRRFGRKVASICILTKLTRN